MNKTIVKRPYRSPLRQAQAEQTRRRILDTGLELFARQGYTATSVAQVAAVAGVSVETIYASVGSKRGIVEALLAAIDTDERPLERARATIDAGGGSPRVALAAVAAMTGRFWSDHARLAEILRKGLGDPEIGDAWVAREAARRGFLRDEFASWPDGTLRHGLDPARAADIAWMLTAQESFARLVEQRGWSLQAYIDWLSAALADQLLA
jgi:AcrR family transcriptional regulator